jgi:hypothetical protein
MRELDGAIPTMGSTCATFQIGPEEAVSDVWVGVPVVTPAGEMICSRDKRLDYDVLIRGAQPREETRKRPSVRFLAIDQ